MKEKTQRLEDPAAPKRATPVLLQAPASGTAIKVTEAAPEVKKKACCSSA